MLKWFRSKVSSFFHKRPKLETLLLSVDSGDIREAIEEVWDCVESQLLLVTRFQEKWKKWRHRLYDEKISLALMRFASHMDRVQLERELADVITQEEALVTKLLDHLAASRSEAIAISKERLIMAEQYQHARVGGLLGVSGFAQKSPACDVIFFHGLDGDAVSTWCFDGKEEFFWPRWLGGDLPQVAVWSRGYDLQSINWHRLTMSLRARAQQTLDLLASKGIGARPLVFICHSMGGLLIKQLLRECNGHNVSASRKAIHANTRALVFFSTPHLGSSIATKLNKFGTLLRTTHAVEDLTEHNDKLCELNEWFKDNIDPAITRILNYCESRPFGALGKIVDRASATVPLPNVETIEVDADHYNVCKLPSKDDHRYRTIKQLITEICESTAYGGV